jgi:hypothetical protein
MGFFILRMVAMVFKCVSAVFYQVFRKHVSCISTTFRRILQPFVFGCFKINRVLHLSSSHLLLHRHGAGRAPIRRRVWVLPNRRRRVPFSSCRSGSAGPACSAKWTRRCTELQGRRGVCRGSAPEMAARSQDGSVEEIGHGPRRVHICWCCFYMRVPERPDASERRTSGG